MSDSKEYAIRGGIEGRERLRMLARVLQPSTSALFDRLEIRDGMACIDVGCGGGDVTVELARRVAPTGTTVGVDIDDTKLELARGECEAQGISNVEFRHADIRHPDALGAFDIVYARFLLTHLSDPEKAVSACFKLLRPGGLLVVEDIDFSGHFTWPESQAFQRYHELYCAVVRERGGDPDIGPRLPMMFKDSGFETIAMSVVQPMGLEGDVKRITPMTMENIADAVLHEGLSTRTEIDDVLRALHAFADDPTTLSGLPRIMQVWGRRPRDQG